MIIDQGRALLSQLRYKAENDTYTHVLRIVGNTIRAARKETEESSLRGTQFYREIQDNEARLVQDLIGTAFVICQAHINSICSRACKIGEFLKDRGSGSTLVSKKAILGLGEPFRVGFPISKVELISAFANYFKHHDEWPWDWSDAPSGSAKATISAIEAAGATRGSSSNLENGLKVLGATDLSQVTVLGSAIKAWVEMVHETAYNALDGQMYPEDLS